MTARHTPAIALGFLAFALFATASAAAQWVLCLDGKNDCDVHHVPVVK